MKCKKTDNFFAGKNKRLTFAHENQSGRSSVRLEYTSGGRVVAGSNPVTPTDGKSLIFNRISRIFLLWYIVRKVAVVHKWYINGRYPKISISVVKYLVVGRLLYLGLYSRSKQADNEFYRVCGCMSCNRVAVAPISVSYNTCHQQINRNDWSFISKNLVL